MNDQFSRIESLFQQAADLPADERAAYLDRECAGDAGLRERVEAMLERLDDGQSLERPTVGTGLLGSPLSEEPGTIIGRYKLLQRLGEGGFGVVYMAEQQEPVVRKVALKIIKLGMDTKQVVARFEAERQALALMDHPNIAKVFDAGATDTGRPFFVMELIRGVPITNYCDRNLLEAQDRLRLFAQVCRAVQHAHQKGIIHRDIKPSNVMVTLHDGMPVPKIIDFGIAKATNRRLTERTLFTEYRQFLGTPAYMSPEQAEMSGLDVDTQSDIYSLGVLLYELLTGTTPFEAKTLLKAGYAEVQRIIREVDPPMPSTRVSTLSDRLDEVARQRKIDASSLSRLIRGDLDWIVMKALEKDRTRRYDTASAFADDVDRYLGCQPVEASPPGTIYQLRKMIRRNRNAVVTVSLVGLALIAGLVGTTWSMLEASRQRDAALQAMEQARIERETAERETNRAQAVTDFLVDMLSMVDPNVSSTPDVSVRTMLDGAANQVENGLHDEPRVEASVRTTIGRAYQSLGESGLAEIHLRRATDLFEALGDVPPGEAYTTLWALTSVLFSLERDDAFEMSKRAREKGNAAISAVAPEVTEKLGRFFAAVVRMDTVTADRQLEEARELAEAQLPANDPTWIIYADTFMHAGYVVWYGPEESASESYFREALRVQRRELSPSHPDIANTLTMIVGVLNRTGRYEKAEVYVRESLEILQGILPDDHAMIAFSESLLGQALVGQGRFAEAESLLVRSHERLAEHAPNTFSSLDNLARLIELYDESGRPDEAKGYREELTRALAYTQYMMPWQISRRAFGPEHAALAAAIEPLPNVAGSYGGTSSSLATEEAWNAVINEVIDQRERLLPPSHPLSAVLARMFSEGLLEWPGGPTAETRRRMLDDTLVVMEHWKQTLWIDYVVILSERSRVAYADGERLRAQKMAREATRVLDAYQGPDYWLTARIMIHLGGVLAEQRQFEDAERMLLDAYTVFQRQFGTYSLPADKTRSSIVRLYERWARPEKARPYVEESIALARKSAERPDASDDDRAVYARWREVESRIEAVVNTKTQ